MDIQQNSSPVPIVELKSVCKSFPAVGRQGRFEALKDISLKIDGEKDKFIVLLGPSGCGKSTMLTLISGLQTADGGEVWVKGQRVTGPNAQSVTVPQAYTCFPWLTALRNVEFGLISTTMGPEERRHIATEYLTKVGLGDRLHAYPRQLSGGMQQRVAIARALALKRPILLMDEPFGALDAQIRVDMQQMLVSLWEEEKNTIIFVTHDISEALLLADRVVVLSANPARIVDDRCVTFRRPRDPDLAQTPEFCAQSQELLRLLRTAPAGGQSCGDKGKIAVAVPPPASPPATVAPVSPTPTAAAPPPASQFGGPTKDTSGASPKVWANPLVLTAPSAQPAGNENPAPAVAPAAPAEPKPTPVAAKADAKSADRPSSPPAAASGQAKRDVSEIPLPPSVMSDPVAGKPQGSAKQQTVSANGQPAPATVPANGQAAPATVPANGQSAPATVPANGQAAPAPLAASPEPAPPRSARLATARSRGRMGSLLKSLLDVIREPKSHDSVDDAANGDPAAPAEVAPPVPQPPPVSAAGPSPAQSPAGGKSPQTSTGQAAHSVPALPPPNAGFAPPAAANSAISVAQAAASPSAIVDGSQKARMRRR